MYQNTDKIVKKWFNPEGMVKKHKVKNSGICPSEHDEQCALVQWLTLKGYTFTSIPNASRRTYWQQNTNKQEGLNAGLPDMLVIINKQLVWIELKKTSLRPKRGGSGGVSEVQREWINELNSCANCQAFVCYGAEEAIAVCQKFDNK